MTEQLNLKQLASPTDERSDNGSDAIQRPRRLVSRYLLPALILFGFLGMVSWAARDQFVKRHDVTVVPVVVTRAEVQTAGTPLFQAAGWVEPRPSRRLATALSPGIVSEVYVVEGQDVTPNQEIARLIDTDAKLALLQAQADLELRNSELAVAQSRLNSAHQRLDLPVQLQAELADAKSKFADAELDLAQLPFQIQSMQAQVKFAQQTYQNRQQAGEAVAVTRMQEAERELSSLNAQLENLENQEPLLKRRIDALRDKVQSLQLERDQLIDERRLVSVTNAEVRVAEARVQQAKFVVQTAELTLSRMVITSPVGGRVLEVLTFPGSTVMGQSPQSNPEASAVVSLYDPKKLQIRADVRLEDVPYIEPTQPVLIETASSSAPLEGHVLLGTSRANIQKNTLEVKVAIDAPPASIRPEMLVRATFLAPERDDQQQSKDNEQQRLLIPRRLVDEAEYGATVWIVTPDRTAHRQSIILGNAGTESLIEVTSGLTATDRVISQGREDLQEQDPVKIRSEEGA